MHNLVSDTLAALISSNGGTPSNELQDHTERVIVHLRDPYFRVMLTQFASKDWSEVLEEGLLPLRERLAIAFQACTHGDVEGLIIAGLTPTGMNILQGYVDRTGDVQTAAILGAHASPAKFVDARAERWLETNRDLLDGFKLFHHRVEFDIERGQIFQDAVQNGDLSLFEWAPRQILIRCNYCSKPMNHVLDGVQKGRPTVYPHCSRALLRCSVRLMTLSIVPDGTREAELSHSHTAYQDEMHNLVSCTLAALIPSAGGTPSNELRDHTKRVIVRLRDPYFRVMLIKLASKDWSEVLEEELFPLREHTIDEAIVICQTCRHGGHASHILDWFFDEDSARSHGMCPVEDCDGL
ncbi:hypothetical protein AZE42_08906 [Rhizopogon vesiculosus]|uniref:Uncharacterized protein n=1 Tax=Rhizopogon vesiculosus TaxID=180088 RepID=A0A1J8Q4J4_9AGAM|nr:hypothetical protein AZE42_08906 [Rhizopogon vesiculosus]